MKVLHVSFSDSEGGAARAAYQVHHALLSGGSESTMMVNSRRLGDQTVFSADNRWQILWNLCRKEFARLLRQFFRSTNPILHSPAWLNSPWPRVINRSDADIVHLHWVQGEMLSIADIRKIRKPIVWTLHDMWLFCGAEHYAYDNRWREGYKRTNRPAHESGFDLNRWAWRRKRRVWKKSLQIVCPSGWLTTLASESPLANNWPTETIGYPIDLQKWTPVDPKVAKALLGLPVGPPLILFGSVGGAWDPRKGLDLLGEALENLGDDQLGANLIIFGESRPRDEASFSIPVHYAGKVFDDVTLRLLYSASDLLALPSRLDNLPLTVVEAMACGTPIVGFSNSGLPTVVRHKTTGYLAPAFDTEELGEGIKWVVNHPKPQGLRLEVRAAAEILFDPGLIARQHVDLYEKVLGRLPSAKNLRAV